MKDAALDATQLGVGAATGDAAAPTIADSRASPRPPTPGARLPGAALPLDLGERYELGPVLGRGGMGEVRLARDVRIDREVAVKLMRGGHGDEALVQRFFREAQVQGVLEHPAVVPVHDLGLDAHGNPYFVMKKLAGTTLHDVLAATDPAVAARWPRRTLLARLVDVCLAIELAHTRGVIHRDLKPANLMLGDFGEAYVLDWGLARVVAEREAGQDAARVGAPGVAPVSADGEPGHTAAGSLLGTPGYMSPEQARGEVVTPASDVYALGCVLFELLAGGPALPRGPAALALAVTVACHRPSERGVDVPPELDDLCARATAADPAARPTARALADGIQAYLDGDRDTARRKELAAEHARAAQAALGDTGDQARARAMREAGRALALDPGNTAAQDVLATMLVATPDEIPAEARAAADEERGRNRHQVARFAVWTYLAILVTQAGLLTWHLRDAVPVYGAIAMSVVSLVLVRRVAREPLPMRSGWYLALLWSSGALLFASGLELGSLMVLPLFVIGAIGGYVAQPTSHHPLTTVAPLVLPPLLLIVLELLEVVPRSFAVEGGRLVLTVPILELTRGTAAGLIGTSYVVQLVASTVTALSSRRAAERSQDRLHAQRWHLQQLLPRDARPAPPADAPRP